MTVQLFEGAGEAANAVCRDLRRRIGQSPGNMVRYTRKGAGLLVHGEVVDYAYIERIDRQTKMCSRPSGFGDSLHDRSYQCTSYTRTGHAHVAITFNVTSTETGEEVFSVTLEDSWTAETRRDRSLPAPINGRDMLEKMRKTLVSRFSKVIVPWNDTVRVRFGRCGKARVHCEAGVEALKEGRFKRAKGAFGAAIRQLRRSRAKERHLAEAYFNLGLARGYSADFKGSVSSLRRAIKLDPKNDDYRRELRNIKRLRQEHDELTR